MEVSVPIQLGGMLYLLIGPLAERGDREFLRDEYRKVFKCFEIKNADARQTFFEERQQLVKRINEVKTFILVKKKFYSRMYLLACQTLHRLGEFTSERSFWRT